VGKENPNHPQPDDLPEHERTGDEPNPSGKHPQHKSPSEQPAAGTPADKRRS
jgi:hypothetical protein